MQFNRSSGVRRPLIQISVAAAIMFSSTQALAGFYSSADITLGNDFMMNGWGYGNPVTTTNGTPANVEVINQTFTGNDSLGNTSTTTLDARATASASRTGLRNYAYIKVSNPIFGVNTPYYDASGPNLAGVPTVFGASAVSGFLDSIEISGTSIASIRISFGISGTMNAVGGDNEHLTWAVLGQGTGPISPYYFLDAPPPKNIADVVVSNSISVIGGIADADFSFLTIAGVTPEFDPSSEGGIFETTVDFSHTINILEVYGYDANGKQVDVGSAIGSDGYRYSLAALPNDPGNAVPEPTSLLLMALGLGALGMASRRRIH